MLAALLALGASAAWGTGDFFGGLSSRRLPVVTVLAVSQAVGLGGLLVLALAVGDAFPGAGDVLPAAGAGLAGAVGLAALYRGMAVGAMGIVAPISAAGPVVPLAVDVARGQAPGPAQWCGIALVLGGVALASREAVPGGARVAAGAGLALLSAASFGLFFVGIDAAADGGEAWAVTVARASSTSLAVAVALSAGRLGGIERRLLPAVMATGVADASANALFAIASTEGEAGVAAVLSSLYPLVTIVLARALLGERTHGAQRAGGLVAVAGVVLVAAG